MSIEAVSWALRQATGSNRAKLVLMILANYADAKGRAWPSQKHLAKICELSVRSLRDQIKMLEEAGLIERTGRWKLAGGRYSDLYTLNIGGVFDRKHSEAEMLEDEPDFFDADELWGQTPSAKPGDVGKDNSKPLAKHEPANPAASVKPAKSAEPANPAGMYRQTLPVPYKEDTKAVDTDLSLRSRSFVRSEVETIFEAFWAAYPPTRRRDKTKCRERFMRICEGKYKPTGKADPWDIVEGAQIYAASVDPQYARMPFTWLNNGNWKEEENYGLDRNAKPSRPTERDRRGAILSGLAGEMDR